MSQTVFAEKIPANSLSNVQCIYPQCEGQSDSRSSKWPEQRKRRVAFSERLKYIRSCFEICSTRLSDFSFEMDVGRGQHIYWSSWFDNFFFNEGSSQRIYEAFHAATRYRYPSCGRYLIPRTTCPTNHNRPSSICCWTTLVKEGSQANLFFISSKLPPEYSR